MKTAFLLLTHAASLALTILVIFRSGERPQVILYAFIFDYLLRLGTIELLARASRGEAFVSLGPLVPYVTRAPVDGEESYPLRQGEDADGRPLGFGGYLVAMAILSFLTFMLIHANAQQELSIDSAQLPRDLGWSALLALLYWTEGVVARSIVLVPGAKRETNFGYNTREVTVLALAVLTAGAVVVVRQANDLDASGWAVLGPLLFFRALYDFTYTLQLRKADNKTKASAAS